MEILVQRSDESTNIIRVVLLICACIVAQAGIANEKIPGSASEPRYVGNSSENRPNTIKNDPDLISNQKAGRKRKPDHALSEWSHYPTRCRLDAKGDEKHVASDVHIALNLDQIDPMRPFSSTSNLVAADQDPLLFSGLSMISHPERIIVLALNTILAKQRVSILFQH